MHKTIRALVVAAALVTAFPLNAQAKHVKSPSQCQRVLGTWRMTSLGISWTYEIKPNGVAVADGWNRMTWSCSSDTVILRNGLGANVRLTLQPDGNNMSGTETSGMTATAVRLSAPPTATAAPAKSSKQVAASRRRSQTHCAARWPVWLNEWLAGWQRDIDEGEMDDLPTAAETEQAHQSFLTQCAAGHEPPTE